jgi:hypothetical protein
MMHLAYWIYSDEALQGGVTERKLVGKAADYLCQRRFEDRDEAEQAAREFIQFCRGRAWVFTDMGTTKTGERLYQFTHRTFLEYFTAANLVRNYPMSEKLAEILLPFIAKQEWDVVAQLAFQLQSKNIEGAADELLSVLINKAAQTEADEGWNLLFFAARCLEFIVPSPRVTRDIARAYMRCCVARKLEEIELEAFPQTDIGDYWQEFEIEEEIIDILFIAATENQAILSDAVINWLIDKVNTGSERESLIVLEIVMALSQDNSEWESISQQVFDTCFKQIEALCQNHLQLCLYAYWLQKISLTNLINWHGLASIFCAFSPMSLHIWVPFPAASLFFSLLEDLCNSKKLKQLDNTLRDLQKNGRIFLSHSLPLSVQKLDFELSLSILSSTLEETNKCKMIPRLILNPEAMFGGFILLAAMLEGNGEKELFKIIKQIHKSQNPFFEFMRWTFIARFEPEAKNKVQAELELCGFTTEQQAFAWRWVRREINLVKQVVASSSEEEDEYSIHCY